ncbi:alpha/beta hydrolase [Thermosipho ferrireducens]|uniref:Alpha/beta hydrolase n=1 Tax=Thermosipho ferrireducens TaxID=2571116 RepID=A0ABX7S4P3_9BACT|nr:alpha/beta hydrolase [Thermosipho ferrireducens]QTA37432.1 alpha/beta hydrolase [Thermosipho ferrireducens]
MPVYKGIYYEVYGKGEPVVLTNGIMMSTDSWKWHIEKLSKYFTVIVFDFIDQGKSKKMERSYKIDLQVKVLKELLYFLNMKAYNIVGLSYGGQVALKLVIDFPDIVKKLVLSNVTAKVDNFLLCVGNVWDFACKLNEGEIFYNLALPFIYGKSFYNDNIEFLLQRKELFKEYLTKEWFEGVRRLIKSNEDFNVTSKLKSIKVPTLLICSDEDFITPYQDMLEMSKNIKNSEVVTVHGAGHGLFLEKKELWVNLIKGFLM